MVSSSRSDATDADETPDPIKHCKASDAKKKRTAIFQSPFHLGALTAEKKTRLAPTKREQRRRSESHHKEGTLKLLPALHPSVLTDEKISPAR